MKLVHKQFGTSFLNIDLYRTPRNWGINFTVFWDKRYGYHIFIQMACFELVYWWAWEDEPHGN